MSEVGDGKDKRRVGKHDLFLLSDLKNKIQALAKPNGG
jgi:hypothetical protein